MSLYKVTDNTDVFYASDVNQLVDALSGNHDFGTLKLFAQLAAPGAPAVAVNATAGNLTGNYQYAVVFVTGYWKGQQGTGVLEVTGTTGYGTASGTVSPSAQQVNLTSIPTGPTGTVARIIARTKSGVAGTYYTVTQINDNTTTTYTDNTADASLGTQLTTTNSTGTFLSLPNFTAAPPIQPAGSVCIINSVLNLSNGTTWDPVAKTDVANTFTAAQTFNAGLTIPSGQVLTNNGTISGGSIQGLASLYTVKVTLDDGNGNMSGVKTINASATAPTNPVDGTPWYDTVNHRQKYYENGAWVDPQKYV